MYSAVTANSVIGEKQRNFPCEFWSVIESDTGSKSTQKNPLEVTGELLLRQNTFFYFQYRLITPCPEVGCYEGQYSIPSLIFHEREFTGSRFHSSSLQILCFRQELAGNTIAVWRSDLLWGKLRLIVITDSSSVSGLEPQTLCF